MRVLTLRSEGCRTKHTKRAQVRKENEKLEEEAARAQQMKAQMKSDIARVQKQLQELDLQKKQATEELERIKQEKVEIKQLAAKKKEVEGTQFNPTFDFFDLTHRTKQPN